MSYKGYAYGGYSYVSYSRYYGKFLSLTDNKIYFGKAIIKDSDSIISWCTKYNIKPIKIQKMIGFVDKDKEQTEFLSSDEEVSSNNEETVNS